MIRAAAAPAVSAPAATPVVDLPTLGLILLTYAAFGIATWFHALLPWWVLVPLGTIIVCFQGSLQHEGVHGYPFRARWANTALLFPSLNLWMPYTLYRHTHLVHHRDENLTLPGIDPESFYVDPIRWQKMPRWQRRIMQATNTLSGRLLLGPAVIAAVTFAQAIRNIAAGDAAAIRDWSLHALGIVAIGIWVVGVCGMHPLVYIACFAYPGTSLTLLRSFAEHRAAHEPGGRTAIVEADWFFGLLYLFNSYHVVHHREPGLVWYHRPRQFHARREEYLTDNGGYRFGGYREIARRYWRHSKEPVAHPMHGLSEPVQP